MVELNTSAAYIRKSSTDISASDDNAVRSQTECEVLELLDSAQTVESLSRRIASDRHIAVGSVSHEVATAMHALLEQDLIELSPDS